MAPVRKTFDIANAAIDALNEMHGTPTQAYVAGRPARVAEVLRLPFNMWSSNNRISGTAEDILEPKSQKAKTSRQITK